MAHDIETDWVDAEGRRHVFAGGVLGGIVDRERLEKQVEQLQADRKILADAVTTALARGDVPEEAARGLWNAIYAVDQTAAQKGAGE